MERCGEGDGMGVKGSLYWLWCCSTWLSVPLGKGEVIGYISFDNGV